MSFPAGHRPDPYADRSGYRTRHQARDLCYFRVSVGETDLHIGARRELSGPALTAVAEARAQVQAMIAQRPRFASALEPLPPLGGETPLIRDMLQAGQAAGVGPMAAVAGAIAQYVGRALLPLSPELIVENGGDIFLAGQRARVVAVEAGSGPLSHKLGVRLLPGPGLAVCTSSGTVGHSLSLGKSDAALVVAAEAALADAAATKLGNLVQTADDIRPALDRILKIPQIRGALVVIGDKIGAQGQIELTALNETG